MGVKKAPAHRSPGRAGTAEARSPALGRLWAFFLPQRMGAEKQWREMFLEEEISFVPFRETRALPLGILSKATWRTAIILKTSTRTAAWYSVSHFYEIPYKEWWLVYTLCNLAIWKQSWVGCVFSALVRTLRQLVVQKHSSSYCKFTWVLLPVCSKAFIFSSDHYNFTTKNGDGFTYRVLMLFCPNQHPLGPKSQGTSLVYLANVTTFFFGPGPNSLYFMKHIVHFT